MSRRQDLRGSATSSMRSMMSRRVGDGTGHRFDIPGILSSHNGRDSGALFHFWCCAFCFTVYTPMPP